MASTDLSYWNLWPAIFQGSYKYAVLWTNEELSPDSVVYNLLHKIHISVWDVLLVALVACVLTAIRWTLTQYVFKPWANRNEVTPLMTAKIPENLWKLLYYTCSWLLSCYVVLYKRHEWFMNPTTVWQGWHSGMVVPDDIYLVYVLQFGFYVHSLYATMYMDAHRKDHVIMMCHHFVTLVLMTFSHGIKMHACGVLVLFCHDINDIFLELWKLNSNLRWRAGGAFYHLHDLGANISFALFMSSWYVCRLYLYPMTVLRACFHDVFELVEPVDMPTFWPLFGCMLVALLLMNMYWFALMIMGTIRILFIGDIDECDDVREFKNATEEYSGEVKKNEDRRNNNNVHKTHID